MRVALSVCLFLCTYTLSASADCQDGWWDCLYAEDDGRIEHSLGGFSYGRCYNYKKAKCEPCRQADVNNPEYIQAKCNKLVPECLGRCTLYADLYSCCFLRSPSEQGMKRALQASGAHEGGTHVGWSLEGPDSGSSSSALLGRKERALNEVSLQGGKVPVCGNLPPGPQAKKEACGL